MRIKEPLELKQQKQQCRRDTLGLIRRGILIKKKRCENCNGEGLPYKKIEIHHCNYNNPLAVLFLCSECHGFYNRKQQMKKNKTLASIELDKVLNKKRNDIIFNLKKEGYNLNQLSKIFNLEHTTIMRIISNYNG